MDSECASAAWRTEGIDHWQVGLIYVDGVYKADVCSMNGEIAIWDVRRPDLPFYENVAQPQGLMALAVHTGASILATCVGLLARR